MPFADDPFDDDPFDDDPFDDDPFDDDPFDDDPFDDGDDEDACRDCGSPTMRGCDLCPDCEEAAERYDRIESETMIAMDVGEDLDESPNPAHRGENDPHRTARFKHALAIRYAQAFGRALPPETSQLQRGL